MQWENLTSHDFELSVQETGVCVLALGVLEKHATHLPLGTDFLNGHQLAALAAEKEPAVVFPPFYFGQIYEARCFPGAVTLRPALLLELLFSVLDEIGRNGFRKIILVNAHGGNHYLLGFLAQSSLWEEKTYQVYVYTGQLSPERQVRWDALLETRDHFHACECETSISLANHAGLVKMDRLPAEPAESLDRLSGVPAAFTGISWYANYPDHYAGDARSASLEKGEKLRAIQVEALAEFIAAVKADQIAPALRKEFFERAARGGAES